MATENETQAEVEKIKAEVEELGRLTDSQEVMLYNIALRQEELGREPTNMLLEKMEANQDIQALLAREYLTYQLYNHGGQGAHQVVNLIVTLKGVRYCIVYGDEIVEKRFYDTAGNRRQ